MAEQSPETWRDVATLPQPAAALAIGLELSRQEGGFILAPAVTDLATEAMLMFSKRLARTAQSKGFRINIFMLHRTLQLQSKNTSSF